MPTTALDLARHWGANAASECWLACRRALDLVYALVNDTNIKMLTRELLEYLKAADADFRPDLTAKICLLVQRFAPSKQWQFDSLLEVGLPWLSGCRVWVAFTWKGALLPASRGGLTPC